MPLHMHLKIHLHDDMIHSSCTDNRFMFLICIWNKLINQMGLIFLLNYIFIIFTLIHIVFIKLKINFVKIKTDAKK